MPALRAFGRRWLLAEDDVPVPAAIMLLYHLVWIGPTIAWYVFTYDTISCKHVSPHTIALSGLLAATVASAISEAAAMAVGLRGAPFERTPRAALPHLVHFNAVLHLIALGFNCYLTSLIADTAVDLDCDANGGTWDPDAYLWALCVAEWVYLGVVAVTAVLLYNPHSDWRDPAAWEAKYMWSAALSSCSCCCGPCGGKARARRRDRARRAGANLCALFGHADLTVTDALLGLAVERILYRRRKKLVAAGGGVGAGGCQKESQTGDPVGADTLAEAHHYFRFALAAYGWMMYLFDGGIGTAASLAVGCLSPLWSCCGAGPVNRRVATAALQNDKNPQNSPEILVLREAGALPDVLSYVLALDHASQSIVLAIRGAISLSDNMRDFLFDPADLGPWMNDAWEGGWTAAAVPTEFRILGREGENEGAAAQGDYLRTSAITLRDVVAQGALAAAAAAHPSYSMVVTGHSLGAAAAFFIALRLRAPGSPLLKNGGREVRCWAFSPPLGLASAAVGTGAAGWCKSVVCGKEIVARYSVATLDAARDWTVEAAARCRQHKLRVLLRWVWSAESLDNDEELVWPEGEPLPPEPAAVLAAAAASAAADPHRRWLLDTTSGFGLPGRVIHLNVVEKRGGREGNPPCCCCACCAGPPPQRIYGATWVPDSGIFREEGLHPSGRLLADHMPDHMGHVLAQVVEESATPAATATMMV